MDQFDYFLTPREIARIGRVSYPTALRWIHGGLFPYLKIGGRIRVRRIDFEKFVHERLTLGIEDEEDVQ